MDQRRLAQLVGDPVREGVAVPDGDISLRVARARLLPGHREADHGAEDQAHDQDDDQQLWERPAFLCTEPGANARSDGHHRGSIGRITLTPESAALSAPTQQYLPGGPDLSFCRDFAPPAHTPGGIGWLGVEMVRLAVLTTFLSSRAASSGMSRISATMPGAL